MPALNSGGKSLLGPVPGSAGSSQPLLGGMGGPLGGMGGGPLGGMGGPLLGQGKPSSLLGEGPGGPKSLLGSGRGGLLNPPSGNMGGNSGGMGGNSGGGDRQGLLNALTQQFGLVSQVSCADFIKDMHLLCHELLLVINQ